MERPCPIRRAGCLARDSLCRTVAALRSRRGRVKYGWSKTDSQKRVVTRNNNIQGSYETSLTRSQEGRRQKRSWRQAKPSSLAPVWTPSEPSRSRSEWLQATKEQHTEVLLAALLASESVHLPRLTILLTSVEGRPDLSSCLRSAGLRTVADAILRSDILQRLLPGGALLDQLMDLVVKHARELSLDELCKVSQMIAVWRPPESCELLAPAAAAVAAALVEYSLKCTTATIATVGRSVDVEVGIAAALEGGVGALMLAEALASLRPWLEWRLAAAGSDWEDDGLVLPGIPSRKGVLSDDTEVVEVAAAALDAVRKAVAALLWMVSGKGGVDAAEPSAVLGVLATAIQYGVEVASELAEAVARMNASMDAEANSCLASAPVAAQIIAYACYDSAGTRNTRTDGSVAGTLLTASEVRGLTTPHLSRQHYDEHHTAFLTALLAGLREGRAFTEPQQRLSSRQQSFATTTVSAARARRVHAVEGLLEALAAAADSLSPVALALAMECAADATAAVLEEGAKGSFTSRSAGLMVMTAAAMVRQRRRAASGACTPEELCMLAAAASRLRSTGVINDLDAELAAAAVVEVLTAVSAMPLEGVSIGSAAALVAGVWGPGAWRIRGGRRAIFLEDAHRVDADGISYPHEVVGPLLTTLLQRLAIAAASADRTENRRRRFPPRAKDLAAAPLLVSSQLSYEQALGVLEVVAVEAEAAVEAVPSTSGSAAYAAIAPPDHRETLRAAALVACRALTPAVRQLNGSAATYLLRLITHTERLGVRPHDPQLLWALHERLRALAASASLSPPDVLDVLHACVGLRWRPMVLLRELLLPLLRWLQHQDAAAAAGAMEVANSAMARGGEAGIGVRGWSPRELKAALVFLAKLRAGGTLAASVVRLGVSQLLRVSSDELLSRKRESGEGATAAAEFPAESGALGASDLSLLLWVCVAMRYRGVSILRPLLQRLLQVPPAQVPVKAAAQAVWSVVRLGVVGERLVRWSLAAAQDTDKLADTEPQSLAILCWGLAKLGVRPPRPFLMAAVAAAQSQLRNFKAQELATVLFVLANWGGRLHGGRPAAAAAVQHVLDTREQYDGPALCTIVWALQQLTSPEVSSATIATIPSSPPAAGPLAAADSNMSVLDNASLRAFENHLLTVNLLTDPKVGFPDHHLLRFVSACAAARGGYRPERLLSKYIIRLRLRLSTMRGVSPLEAPAQADRRSRMLWSAARIMATYNLRDTELLTILERCCERCQSLLHPGHLAGVLNAMATLGHYPGQWAQRGLLRRVGLALRVATLTEAILIMEAVAAWRQNLLQTERPSASASPLASALTSPLASTTTSSPLASASTSPLASASTSLLASASTSSLASASTSPLASASTSSSASALTSPLASASTSSSASTTTSSPPFPATSLPTASDAARPPSPAMLSSDVAMSPATASAAAPIAVTASISLDDAMRLLAALARLRWQCGPVESALVRVVAALPRYQGVRVPQLTTLLWSLAALRRDCPELLEDLQAALLGLPPQPSLSAEMLLLETGQAAAVRVADRPEPSTSVVATASVVGASSAETEASSMDATEPAADAPSADALKGASHHPSAETAPSSYVEERPSEVVAKSAASSNSSTTTTSGGDDGKTAPVAGCDSNNIHAASRNLQLLSRPMKSMAQASDPTSESAAAAQGTIAFDAAASMAATAAEANQRLELGKPMGLFQLPSEVWAPVDVFKTLWACAKMNRHPGPAILAAAERSWLQYTADVTTASSNFASAKGALPLHTITGLLWSLSVFRHHNSSFAQLLAQQLGAWLRGGESQRETAAAVVVAREEVVGEVGMEEAAAAGGAEDEVEREAQLLRRQLEQRLQEFLKQAVQVAACLLAAQADRVESPLNLTLLPEVRARLVAVWRARLATRLAKSPNRYQVELVSVLRKMGLTAAANVATPDGCALVDVAVALRGPPPSEVAGFSAQPVAPRLLALELVGRHNTAANSRRILGEAVMKYRLLQARGYLVVPIACYEWDRINYKDVRTKMMHLQAKIDRRTGPMAVAAAAKTAVTTGAGTVAPMGAGNGEGSRSGN